jgi:hypothetical protein
MVLSGDYDVSLTRRVAEIDDVLGVEIRPVEIVGDLLIFLPLDLGVFLDLLGVSWKDLERIILNRFLPRIVGAVFFGPAPGWLRIDSPVDHEAEFGGFIPIHSRIIYGIVGIRVETGI